MKGLPKKSSVKVRHRATTKDLRREIRRLRGVIRKMADAMSHVQASVLLSAWDLQKEAKGKVELACSELYRAIPQDEL